MYDYNYLIQLNNKLRTNPFLSSLTVQSCRSGIVYFTNGEHCKLDYLVQALLNEKGYVTNLSFLKNAIDSANNRELKERRHQQLQQRLKENVIATQERKEELIEEYAKEDRISMGIKLGDMNSIANVIADKFKSLTEIEADKNTIKYILGELLTYVPSEDVYILVIDRNYKFVNSKKELSYLYSIVLLTYMAYFIDKRIREKHSENILNILKNEYKDMNFSIMTYNDFIVGKQLKFIDIYSWSIIDTDTDEVVWSYLTTICDYCKYEYNDDKLKCAYKYSKETLEMIKCASVFMGQDDKIIDYHLDSAAEKINNYIRKNLECEPNTMIDASYIHNIINKCKELA